MRIGTACPSIDELLGGGVETGCITLLYGEAGTGKTNLCLQLATNVARQGRKVVYIDTEGLSAERLRQIGGEAFEVVLQNLLISDPLTFEDQEKQVERAARFCEGDQNVGLVVLDSATLHFRLTRKDEEREDRQSLNRQVTKLMRIARKSDVPVVITSQVYTDIETGSFEPLGGHMLAHNAKAILRLEKVAPGLRLATIVKHRHLPEGLQAKFRLTDRGLEAP
jgi:DNA repair protein RadB